MAHMMPDSTVAGNMYNQAKPVNDDEK
jgi:hypothetical protein